MSVRPHAERPMHAWGTTDVGVKCGLFNGLVRGIRWPHG